MVREGKTSRLKIALLAAIRTWIDSTATDKRTAGTRIPMLISMFALNSYGTTYHLPPEGHVNVMFDIAMLSDSPPFSDSSWRIMVSVLVDNSGIINGYVERAKRKASC